MIRLLLITLFTLTGSCIAVYTIWTLRVTGKKSNDLLTEFRKMDTSLNRSNDSLQNNIHGVGAFKRGHTYLPEVELAVKANAINRCIDSMKHDLFILAKQKGRTSFTYPDKPRLQTLKNNLADYNSFIQKNFSYKPGIKQGDYINMTDVSIGTAFIPWERYYFQDTNIFSVISTLTFINTQVLKLQQKAIH